MKKLGLMALALAIVFAGATDGFAQTTKKGADRTAFTVDTGHMDSKHLVGMRVRTPGDNKDVGEIDHLIVNLKDGKVTHAVVGFGGLAGVKEQHVVVPWNQVKITANPKDPGDRKDTFAYIGQAVLDGAPKYVRVDRGAPAASPPLAPGPAGDRDRDGVKNRLDRAPDDKTKR